MQALSFDASSVGPGSPAGVPEKRRERELMLMAAARNSTQALADLLNIGKTGAGSPHSASSGNLPPSGVGGDRGTMSEMVGEVGGQAMRNPMHRAQSVEVRVDDRVLADARAGTRSTPKARSRGNSGTGAAVTAAF